MQILINAIAHQCKSSLCHASPHLNASPLWQEKDDDHHDDDDDEDDDDYDDDDDDDDDGEDEDGGDDDDDDDDDQDADDDDDDDDGMAQALQKSNGSKRSQIESLKRQAGA